MDTSSIRHREAGYSAGGGLVPTFRTMHTRPVWIAPPQCLVRKYCVQDGLGGNNKSGTGNCRRPTAPVAGRSQKSIQRVSTHSLLSFHLLHPPLFSGKNGLQGCWWVSQRDQETDLSADGVNRCFPRRLRSQGDRDCRGASHVRWLAIQRLIFLLPLQNEMPGLMFIRQKVRWLTCYC